MSDYTDNPIARAWKKRYQSFSPDIQYKLDALYNASSKEYQFNVIKKSRKHPSKGDVFIINPTEDLFLYGVVLNSNINNICGNDLYVIIILKNRVESNIYHNLIMDFIILENLSMLMNLEMNFLKNLIW